MNILEYISQIRQKINKINSYVEQNDRNNPFMKFMPVTYVWLEKDENTNC